MKLSWIALTMGITLHAFFFYFKCFQRTAHAERTSSPLKEKQYVDICNAARLWGISQQQSAAHPCISCSSGATIACRRLQGLSAPGPGGLQWANTQLDLGQHNPAPARNKKKQLKVCCSFTISPITNYFSWSPGLLAAGAGLGHGREQNSLAAEHLPHACTTEFTVYGSHCPPLFFVLYVCKKKAKELLKILSSLHKQRNWASKSNHYKVALYCNPSRP